MKGKKTGGREKGTPNKATADVKALAQEYTPEAIRVLARIMSDEDEPAAARVSAANALLDRAHARYRRGSAWVALTGRRRSLDA